MFGRKYKLRSKKYIREKRRQLLLDSGIRFGIVLLFITLFALIAHLEQFYITDIKISGNDVIQKHEIHEIASSEIEGKYFKIFPRYNSVIFPRNSIAASIVTKYRRVEDIDVSFSNFHTIKIEVREREPKGVWCSKEEGEPCYFLDNDGYIFSQAPLFSGNLFFKYHGGEIGEKVIGSFYLPTERFKEIAFFIKSLGNIGLYPTIYEWGDEGDSSVIVVANEGARLDTTILFNNKDDLSRIFENIQLVLEDDAFVSDEVIELEYIDLRFGNKIFFK